MGSCAKRCSFWNRSISENQYAQRYIVCNWKIYTVCDKNPVLLIFLNDFFEFPEHPYIIMMERYKDKSRQGSGVMLVGSWRLWVIYGRLILLKLPTCMGSIKESCHNLLHDTWISIIMKLAHIGCFTWWFTFRTVSCAFILKYSLKMVSDLCMVLKPLVQWSTNLSCRRN